MKIIKRGTPPPPPDPAWYRTTEWTCEHCGTVFIPDAGELVHYHQSMAAPDTARMDCPVCHQSVALMHPDQLWKSKVLG